MLPIGLQLYTLRQAAEQDFRGVLKRVADMGYKLVEPAGFWDLRPSEFIRIVRDLGMDVISSQSPWAHNKADIGVAMEEAELLGLKRIVCGYPAENFKDLDAIKRTADNTNTMLEILSRNGFTLFQHNHDFEFQRLDGRLKYEIYRELVPGLKFELDSFWSTSLGREDPVEMLKIFAADTILLHLKDGWPKQDVSGSTMVNGILERQVELCPLGKGTLPLRELVELAPSTVEALFVELDFCNEEMFSAVEQSYRYLTENGLAKGNR